MIVSVAICTWNRARLLEGTLAGFVELSIPPGVEWELLVVNNNCTDETDEVIARFEGRLPIRRFQEPDPGLSRARNRAIAEASGELLLWTDDDVLVDEDWLASYVQAATRFPSAAFFGGVIEPQFEVEPPAWIVCNTARLADPFAILQLGPETRALGNGEVVLGANMAIRAWAFRDFQFDVRFGVRGASRIGGEEVYVQELVEQGHFGAWVGSARVRHVISADRLTVEYLRRCFRGYGRTKARHEGAPPCPTLLGYPRFAVRKYLAARVTMARRPVGDPRWVDAMATSAFLEGYLAEARRGVSPLLDSQAGPPPEAGRPVLPMGARAGASGST
jgi:hypothetical protein